jgi:ERCC4-related helicase
MPKELRRYQAEIVASIEAHGNTIVVLPTGAGKTLVAAEYFKRRIARGAAGAARPLLLFAVPARFLVRQQAAALREWLGPAAAVAEFMGGAAEPPRGSYQVLVATPSALLQAQDRGAVPAFNAFAALVFDEVHHVLRDHPYRAMAQRIDLLRADGLPTPAIVGLSASLTYAFRQSEADLAIRTLARDLSVRKMESRSPKKLAADGYTANGVTAEVCLPELVVEGVVPPEERGPLSHDLLGVFVRRIEAGTATATAMLLWRLTDAIEAAVAGDAAAVGFTSPRSSPQDSDRRPVAAWGKVAHDAVIRALNLGRASPAAARFQDLEHCYEALRLLIVSWEELPDAIYAFCDMHRVGSDAAAARWPPAVAAALAAFYAARPAALPRFDNLKAALLARHRPGFRGVLFTEQRVLAHVLRYYIMTTAELAVKFVPVVIHAETPATASLKVSKRQLQERMARFGDAAHPANLLVATSVAEEGMDVPAAHCVVRFDAVMTPVSFVQGRGRARQADSEYVVLSERGDRTAAQLARAETLQTRIVVDFVPDAERREAGRQEQGVREAKAAAVFAQRQLLGAMQCFKTFCQKVAVAPDEAYAAEAFPGVPAENGGFRCTLRYRSAARSVEASACAQGKKAAGTAAAEKIIAALQKDLERCVGPRSATTVGDPAAVAPSPAAVASGPPSGDDRAAAAIFAQQHVLGAAQCLNTFYQKAGVRGTERFTRALLSDGCEGFHCYLEYPHRSAEGLPPVAAHAAAATKRGAAVAAAEKMIWALQHAIATHAAMLGDIDF